MQSTRDAHMKISKNGEKYTWKQCILTKNTQLKFNMYRGCSTGVLTPLSTKTQDFISQKCFIQ